VIPISFVEATRVHRASGQDFEAFVPRGWEQGQGCFGGIVLGIAIRAMLAVESRWPLRVITADFTVPISPGPVSVRVVRVRAGSSSTLLRATFGREGQELAAVTGLYGEAVAVVREWWPTPEIEDWRSRAATPLGWRIGPAFARAFEYRPSRGACLIGSSTPDTLGFVHHLTEHGSDLAALVALADAWWPSPLVVARELRYVVATTLILQLLAQPTQALFEAPLLHRGFAVAGADGYYTEHRSLWTPTGSIVAACTQILAHIP
jgi:hypothetical protein